MVYLSIYITWVCATNYIRIHVHMCWWCFEKVKLNGQESSMKGALQSCFSSPHGNGHYVNFKHHSADYAGMMQHLISRVLTHVKYKSTLSTSNKLWQAASIQGIQRIGFDPRYEMPVTGAIRLAPREGLDSRCREKCPMSEVSTIRGIESLATHICPLQTNNWTRRKY